MKHAMTATGIALLGASFLFAILFFHPRLPKSLLWRATVTPLASIIGSGFLWALGERRGTSLLTKRPYVE